MAKETIYPSQINTKTISCRISAVDYVNFLTEALSKGITLNDWLLMKIYNQKQNKNDLIGSNEDSKDNFKNVLEFPFTLEIDFEEYTFTDLEDIESFIIMNRGNLDNLLESVNIGKKTIVELEKRIELFSALEVDLYKKSDRAVIYNKFIEIINQTEWETSQDKKEVLKDLRELYLALFD